MSQKSKAFDAKGIDFNNFYIEAPNGKKVLIHAVFSRAPDYRKYGFLAVNKLYDAVYGEIVDAAAELGECKVFIDAQFNPKAFLEMLKAKGYKVYWA